MSAPAPRPPPSEARRFLKKHGSLLALAVAIGLVLYLYYGIPSDTQRTITDRMEPYIGSHSAPALFLAYGGTLLVAVAQAYTLVKRVGIPKVMVALGGPGLWLNIHIALAIVGLLAVLVHAGFPYAFQAERLTAHAYAGLATWLLLIETVSGVFGRYLYRRLPAGKGLFGYWKEVHVLVTVLFFIVTFYHIVNAEAG